MIPSEAQAVTLKSLVPAQDCTALSGVWTGVLAEGEIVMIEDVGEITGSFTGSLYTAIAADGTGATIVEFEDGTTSEHFTVSGHLHKKIFNARQCLGFLGYLGVITSGPIGIAVSVMYRPKETV
jgi:hypothetical protein